MAPISDVLLGGPSGAEAERRREEEARLKCEQAGGQFINGQCIIGTPPTPAPTPEPEPKPTTPASTDVPAGGGAIDTEATARAVGRETPSEEFDRAVRSGVSQSSAQAIFDKRTQEEATQTAIANIGQLGKLTAAQEADINFSQAATAGAVGAIPGVIGGALGGGTIGALGGPVGAVGGAVIGATGGFVAGILGNIKEQQRGELSASKTSLTDGRTAMRQFAMMASRDPANADVWVQLYNDQLTIIHQSRRQTKAETTGDLNAFMEDGREQMAQFDSFLAPGRLADTYGLKIQTALDSGVPLSINGEQLFFDTEDVE